ncbi:MAG: hypothetical protein RMK92_00370 [Armatimonadota bacterium]|nr:hypothetical protein [Armatimonadota bacterium]
MPSRTFHQAEAETPPTEDPMTHVLGRVVLAMTLLFFLSTAIALWRIPSWALASLTPDDAFYYFKIARNFVQGYGFSFDTINPTNGFQPLWMYLLLLPAYFTREMDVEVFPRVGILYQYVLLLAATLLLYQALRKWCPLAILLLSSAIVILLGLRVFVNGMETIVVFLVFATNVWYLSRQEMGSLTAGHFAVVGVLAALVFLSRLDSVFAMLIWMLLQAVLVKQNRLPWSYLLYMVVAAGALAAPYLLYNWVAFGDWMPISGRLKNSFPRIEQIDWGRVPTEHLLALTALSTALWWLWRRTPQQRLLMLFLLAWLLGSGVHALHTILFMKWAVFKWHFSSYWMPLAVLLPLLLTQFQRTRWRRLAYAAGTILWLTLAVSLVLFVRETVPTKGLPTWARATYQAARWTRQHTPPHAVLAMKDAGRFGYYSDRRVINLDGLVNNMQLQEQIRAGKLRQYLQDRGVRFLVQHAITPDSQMVEDAPAVTAGIYRRTRIFYLSQLYNVYSEGIPLYRDDERFRTRHRGGVFLIWALR